MFNKFWNVLLKIINVVYAGQQSLRSWQPQFDACSRYEATFQMHAYAEQIEKNGKQIYSLADQAFSKFSLLSLVLVVFLT